MSESPREIATATYWNKRVRESDNLQDMLFRDPRRDVFWSRVRKQLELWKDMTAVDVCCGYGQFADIFVGYIGVDISSEMLKLAKQRHPQKTFVEADILKTSDFKGPQLVFEVNSLHSLGLTPEQFAEKFPEAQIVACLECDRFTIFNRYGGR